MVHNELDMRLLPIPLDVSTSVHTWVVLIGFSGLSNKQINMKLGEYAVRGMRGVGLGRCKLYFIVHMYEFLKNKKI